MKKLMLIALAVAGILSLLQAAYAIMPPDVYAKAIADSPVKAEAIVREVEIVEETRYYTAKKVEFELVRSYGETQPSGIFYGYCKSATENMLVGGTIYYYPEKDEEVFVTLDGEGSLQSRSAITSLTPMSEELRSALAKSGISGIEYGIGKVAPEE